MTCTVRLFVGALLLGVAAPGAAVPVEAGGAGGAGSATGATWFAYPSLYQEWASGWAPPTGATLVPPWGSALRAARDPETGGIGLPSAEQIRRMEELERAALPAIEPVTSQAYFLPDGTGILPLGPQFLEFLVIERGRDGRLELRCLPADRLSLSSRAARPGVPPEE